MHIKELRNNNTTKLQLVPNEKEHAELGADYEKMVAVGILLGDTGDFDGTHANSNLRSSQRTAITSASEFADAQRSFALVELYPTADGKAYVRTALQTSNGKHYVLSIKFPDNYPNEMPRVFIDAPTISIAPHGKRAFWRETIAVI